MCCECPSSLSRHDLTPIRRLQFPLTPVLWEGGTQETVRERILLKGDPAEAKKYGSYTRSLLSLRVLVQNRRKDKAKALIFGAQAQAISHAETVEIVMKGKREGDRIFTFQSARYVAQPMLAIPLSLPFGRLDAYPSHL